MSNADTEVLGDNDGSASLGSALTGSATPAHIVYYLFEDPTYFDDWGAKGIPFRLAAVIIGYVINLMILVSTVAFCFETMDDYSLDPHRNPLNWDTWDWRWTAIEITCVVAFTCDLMIRGFGAAAAGKGSEFVGDPMNWIDFLAIFPFYVRQIWSNFVDLRFLRVIRLARILRSLKSARYGSLGAVVVDIVKNSVGALFIPVYFMILALIVFSSVMFYIEQTVEQKCHLGDGTTVNQWDTRNTTVGNEGCSTAYGCTCAGTLTYHTYDEAEWSNEMFESIPDSFWWCIVTFTTVGYGDKYPRTTAGRFVCAVTMFCGIFFLAMPLTIVGSSFSDAWDKLQTRKLKMAAHDKLAAKEWTPDYEKVAALKSDCKAHLLRGKALMEQLRLDAVNNNAGKEVGEKWDQVMDLLADADDGFDDIMTLYKLDDDDEDS